MPIPIELKGLPAEATGLCQDKPSGPAWLDRMQAGLYRTMCHTAARFDGFFGNARFDDEYQATYGSIAVGALWDERDHWDPSLRFRVRLQLPQLSERFNGFIGRVDPDEYVTELRDDFDTLPRQFAGQDDDAVLLGLGYSQPGRGGGHFDADVGARVGFPMDPYVKGRYRLALPFLARNVLRLRETIFWQNSEGLGATTRFDLERLLAKHFLVRWSGSGTLTQESEGVRWFSSMTLYQSLGDGVPWHTKRRSRVSPVARSTFPTTGCASFTGGAFIATGCFSSCGRASPGRAKVCSNSVNPTGVRALDSSCCSASEPGSEREQ